MMSDPASRYIDISCSIYMLLYRYMNMCVCYTISNPMEVEKMISYPAFIYIYMYTYIYIYIYIYLYICVYIYIHMYTYIYI
jgi:hypothetical protein